MEGSYMERCAATITAISAIVAAVSGLLLFYLSKRAERQAVNKAILAEIQRLLFVLDRHCGYWNTWAAKRETKKHPLIRFSCDIYAKHVDKMGLLDQKYVGLIVKFYGDLDFLNSLQATQARDWELHEGSPDSFDEKYTTTLERVIATYRGKFDCAFALYGLPPTVEKPATDHSGPQLPGGTASCGGG
jgi:hypothetical protein